MPPEQSSCVPNSICKDHFHYAHAEIKALLCTSVIIGSSHESGEFVSPIFTVPKSGDNVRLILNVKILN